MFAFLVVFESESFLNLLLIRFPAINVIHYTDYLLFVLPATGELGAAVRDSPIRTPTTRGSLFVFSTDFLVCSICLLSGQTGVCHRLPLLKPRSSGEVGRRRRVLFKGPATGAVHPVDIALFVWNVDR